MHAVVVSVAINDPEAALENLKSNIVPRVQQAPGFVTGHWYGDGQTKGASTLIFDSEENARGFIQMVREQPGTGAAEIQSIEAHEVVANA